MYTVHVVAVNRDVMDVDFWASRTTAERVRADHADSGHTVYAFSLLVESVVNLEARLLKAAEYFPLFHNSPEPIQLQS